MIVRVLMSRTHSDGSTTIASWYQNMDRELESVVGFMEVGDVVTITTEVLPERTPDKNHTPYNSEEPF